MKTIKEYKNDSVIKYHALKHQITIQRSEEIFDALKIFLQQAVLTDKLVPSPEIDACWHSFILHTEDYHNFCSDYLGRFIHHHPHVDSNASVNQSHFECGCETGGGNSQSLNRSSLLSTNLK